MDKQNLIIWQKWTDPFGEEEDSIDEEYDPFVGDYEYDDTGDDAQYNKQKESGHTPNKKTAIKVIATPMGIIPMNENTMSGKIFNFWIGHTNFDISKKIADIIERTSGVETLDIFTRYRFRISVGKAFDDSETMRNINTRVYRELNHA